MSDAIMLASFGSLDWVILGFYLLFMLWLGVRGMLKEKAEKTEEFFLARRSMPTWLLAISIVGSSLSAATFTGVPDRAFRGNLTYLILNIGGFMAVLVVGFWFVPKLYRAGTVTVYGFVAQRFGETARLAVAGMFLLGRLLASGARLYLAAIPLCMLIFGFDKPTFVQLSAAIALVGFIGTFYTIFGGIRTVVWVDLIQFALVIGAVLISIGILLHRIPMGLGEIIDLLRSSKASDGTSKLKLIDTSFDLTKPFTLWAAITGSFLASTAAFGVDQDLAQRFLVAKSPARGAISVIASQFISILVVSLFMVLGLLLFVYYRPDLISAKQPGEAVYQRFLLQELPSVLSGFAIVGLFAVAQGSMDSAVNAMAGSVVADFYLPLKRRRGPVSNQASTEAPRLAVMGIGILMTSVGILCALIRDEREELLDFALSVMVFAFSGMLAVFVTGLFTRRGNTTSVVMALTAGFIVTLLMYKPVLSWLSMGIIGREISIEFTYAMTISTITATLICMVPSGRTAQPSIAVDH